MNKEALITEIILLGLKSKLTGESLREFVQRSTKCNLVEFEKTYEKVIRTWIK